MRIVEVSPKPNWILSIVAEDGRIGYFDVSPYLEYAAFELLRDFNEFTKIYNGGYFIEWDCGADLSTDTIEGRWQVVDQRTSTENYAKTTSLSTNPPR
jgi:hypothetical protein